MIKCFINTETNETLSRYRTAVLLCRSAVQFERYRLISLSNLLTHVSVKPAASSYKILELCHPEDGGRMILRNVNTYPHSYTASHPTRPHFS